MALLSCTFLLVLHGVSLNLYPNPACSWRTGEGA